MIMGDINQGFGWAPVGQRLLNEYSQGTQQHESGPNANHAKAWTEIKALQTMQHIVGLAVNQMRLLHAVDTFPRGGLCQGPALKEALRRYEKLWLPLVAAQTTASQQQMLSTAQRAAASSNHSYHSLVPPLDVAFLWHLHRLQPEQYEQDCRRLRGQDGRPVDVLHVTAQQAFAFSDGRDPAGAATAALWHRLYPHEPFWPPATPAKQTESFASSLSADLAAVAVRMPVFLHQLLRACYIEVGFFEAAVVRYTKFLLLVKHHLELQHPIPPLDIGLMWSSHMSVSGVYAADCKQILHRTLQDMPGASASLWIECDQTGPWRFHWSNTWRAWSEEFREPFLVPGSGYVPLDSAHPAESSIIPQALACYEQPAAAATGGSWRAGAHALYLLWLKDPCIQQQQQQQHESAAAARQKTAAQQEGSAAIQQPEQPQQQHAPVAANGHSKQHKESGGLLMTCFGCCGGASDADGGDDRPTWQTLQSADRPARVLTDTELLKLAGGFSSFKNLPHTCTHPYWQMFSPRIHGTAINPDTSKPEGAKLRIFNATTAATETSRYSASHNYNGTDSAGCDQDGVNEGYDEHLDSANALIW